jgi:hypothetical protein
VEDYFSWPKNKIRGNICYLRFRFSLLLKVGQQICFITEIMYEATVIGTDFDCKTL